MNAGQQKENGHRKDIQKTRDGRIFRMSQTVHPTLLSWLFFSTSAKFKDEAKGYKATDISMKSACGLACIVKGVWFVRSYMIVGDIMYAYADRKSLSHSLRKCRSLFLGNPFWILARLSTLIIPKIIKKLPHHSQPFARLKNDTKQ